MCTIGLHGEGELTIQGERIAAVDSYRFLGSLVKANNDCTTDIKARLAMARTVVNNLRHIWKSKEFSITSKVRIAKSLICSVALYGCESWIMKKADVRRVAAFEMWLWRRMLGIRWTERRTNDWVRNQVNSTEETSLLQQLKIREIKKYCHWRIRPSSLVLQPSRALYLAETDEDEGESRGWTTSRHGRRRMYNSSIAMQIRGRCLRFVCGLWRMSDECDSKCKTVYPFRFSTQTSNSE